mgnify:CR=1 FL=1
MNESRLRDWLEIVGIAAVVATLVFVGYEIRQSGREALSADITGDFDTWVNRESIIVENADVWLRGCQAEELSPVEQMQFTRMYHLSVFSYFMRWLRSTRGIAEAGEALSIDNMAWNLYRITGLRREWDLHGDWRPHVSDQAPFQRWRALVEARVAEYPAFEPEPIRNDFRCGLN